MFRRLVRDANLEGAIEIDSAGTGGHHVGEPSDSRSRAAAKRRGYSLDGTARQFVRSDFTRFDLVVAMDGSNRKHLLSLAPDDTARAMVSLLRDFDATSPEHSDVPDPYYGGPRGFDEVIDICERGCAGLLAAVRTKYGI